jgi:hypothetical protein
MKQSPRSDQWDTSAAVLDLIWGNWNCAVDKNEIYQTSYQHVTRNSSKGKRFEDWLYEHGAFIVQRNKLRFIRFYNEDAAVMFMLRWT